MDYRDALAYALDYLNRDDIRSVMVGYKYVGGKRTNVVSIQFGVAEKIAASQLDPDKLLPATIKGMTTDVVVCKPKPCTIPQSPWTILTGGLSIGPEYANNISGTLGLILEDLDTNELVGLTNYHVVACTGTPMVPYGYIVQPSINDGGTVVTDRIGSAIKHALNEWYDAATVSLSRQAVPQIYDTKQLLLWSRFPELGDNIEKVGRSTGTTTGIITGWGYVQVDFSDWGYSANDYYYVMAFADVDDGVVIAAGDSGSVLYCTDDDAALGLVMAEMNEEGLVGYACVLDYVLEDFNLALAQTVINSKEVSCGTSVGSKARAEIAMSFHNMGVGVLIAPKVTAIQDESAVYTTMAEYAIDQGYASEAAFLTAVGFATSLLYVNSLGYMTVASFLSAMSVPDLETVLALAGVTFTDV